MIRLVVVGILACAHLASGQSEDPAFLAGLSLEKKFQVEEALEQYEAVLKRNPNHVGAMIHASRMLSNVAGRLPASEVNRKRELLVRSQAYARHAIQLNERSTDARLAHIITLGLLSEIATNPREKVVDARLIHGEAIAILAVDTTYAEAYFVLGKWHLELARLNWMELMACKLFFGGFPEEVSTEAALRYFNKALHYNPTSILFLFGQASAYYDLEKFDKASSTLQHALALPPAEPDDIIRKERCANLQQQVNYRSQPAKATLAK